MALGTAKRTFVPNRRKNAILPDAEMSPKCHPDGLIFGSFLRVWDPLCSLTGSRGYFWSIWDQFIRKSESFLPYAQGVFFAKVY